MNRSQNEPGLHDMQFGLLADQPWSGQHPYDQEMFESDRILHIPQPTVSASEWDPAEELAEMLGAATAMDPSSTLADDYGPTRHRVDRRRSRPGVGFLDKQRKAIPAAILVALIIACSVTMLGWSISYSYNQLRAIALLVEPRNLARWWPLTVYGPWLLAGLSILRASVLRRSARRSWTVMLLSSGTAVVLCVGHSPHSALAMVIVGIPPITALVCFRELVGQMSSPSGPRHATHTAKHSNDG
ncbi:hypothetical protein GCM10011579_028440 [Streptomyces albiflavescens]|uniref:DUF2637 domain-containing protein n=1 Tax=Streptomyces albiflavescens TaxID=1623582 RepID=A0A917Y0G0_9ACTN|nr:DUF2637 domain-containing protein [Streptomyces albiflavescens]GGN61812.1 hypothetical protein GCM10011579_028440 [Streptomyces albiflavescens]